MGVAHSEDLEQRMNRVIDHVRSHLEGRLDLDELAQVASYSPYHFHRLFRREMGETLGEFVRRIRLEDASCRLKDPRSTVTEVAFASGFSSPAAFSKAFSARFSTSPSKWRVQALQNSNRGQVDRKLGKATSAPGSYPSASGGKRMKVEIIELEPMTLAYVRHIGPYDEPGISAAYERLFGWAEGKGLARPGTRVVGVSHSDPAVTAPEHCIYDAALEIPADQRDLADAGVGTTRVPPGRCASVDYEGPPEGISDAYSLIYGEWLPSSGLRLRGEPALEIFPTIGEEPEDRDPQIHRLRICVPIE